MKILRARHRGLLPTAALLLFSGCAASGVGSRNSDQMLAGKLALTFDDATLVSHFERSRDLENQEHQRVYTTTAYARTFILDFATGEGTWRGTDNSFPFDYSLRGRHLRVCILGFAPGRLLSGGDNLLFSGEFDDRHGEWLEGEFWGRLVTDSEADAERGSLGNSEFQRPGARTVTDVMSVHGEILRSEWGRALRVVPRQSPPLHL